MPTKRPDYTVVDDLELGYRHLDPLPAGDDLDEFYQSAYIDMIRQGKRFPEAHRLLLAGEDAEAERSWIRATLHADILDALATHIPVGSRSLVDIGAGIGEFVASAVDGGWSALGLEPSQEAVDYAQEKGRPVVCATLDSYLEEDGFATAPSAAVLTWVLEHVLDPIDLIRTIYGILPTGGILAVRVPNDFNPLQQMARVALDREPWWIAAPDHVNYFNHASLRRVVEDLDFEVVDQWTDFPMELFLLMGDYVGDGALGPVCHVRRRRFEMRLDHEARRAFYRALVPLGWGRNSVIIARARPSA